MYGKDFEDELDRLESRYPEDRKRAALLMALHAVQRRQGNVPADAQAWLADRYGIGVSDVRGVISFYTMFHEEKPGQHVIWLCRTLPCQLHGAAEVMKAFEEELGCRVGESDAKGEFGLRWQECLAACDKAPCALIDDDMYDCITPESVKLVLEHVRGGGGGGVVETGDGGKPKLVPAPLAPELGENLARTGDG